MDDVFHEAEFTPSGQRSGAQLAAVVSTGRQPGRGALPQLLPDGLPPDVHLKAALALQHPFCSAPSTTPAVKYAMTYALDSAATMVERRGQVSDAIEALATSLDAENNCLLGKCSDSVAAVLNAFERPKHIALMRELQFVAQLQDAAAPCGLALGLPMLGQSAPVRGLLPRHRQQTTPIAEWETQRVTRNAKIVASVTASSDPSLDAAAFQKSLDEKARGVLRGPFEVNADLGIGDISLVPRRGIWELHGGAEEASCRVIDDLLFGEQNSTVETFSAHRPTDVDGLAAQTRAVAHRFPRSRLKGWPSDYAKAYKQVPTSPNQLRYVVVVQWDPTKGRPVLWVALSQLFGGSSSPLNFARFPAWMCEALAVFFAVAVSHCVDDMIGVDPDDVVMSGWRAWRRLAKRCGWEVSDAKSPLPSQRFMVIGVTLCLTNLPVENAFLSVSEKRLVMLDMLLARIVAKGMLSSGEAASLCGKLGFALCAVFGRVGRAKLRPIIKRCGERHRKLHTQLMACLLWWRLFLSTYRHREIPTSLTGRPLVVTYSDGEGDAAGVGICIFCAKAPRPLAAFAKMPECIRQLWARRAGEGEYHDIFLIEAIGPLLVLCTYPNLLRGAAWIHFIDNTAAQHSLLKGCSSITSGDHVVGLTWERASALDCWPYFDRVHTKSNPIDGVSRQDFQGPWAAVTQAVVPLDMLTQMERACTLVRP